MWIRSQKKLNLRMVSKITTSVIREDDVRVGELQVKLIKGNTYEELELLIKQFKEQNKIEVVDVRHYGVTDVTGEAYFGVGISYYELKPQQEYLILDDGFSLGSYSTEEKMIEVLNAIQRAIARGEAVYEMPSDEEVGDW